MKGDNKDHPYHAKQQLEETRRTQERGGGGGWGRVDNESEVRNRPPLSTRRKVGNPPALDLKEISNSSKLLQAFVFAFGNITRPTIVPPY